MNASAFTLVRAIGLVHDRGEFPRTPTRPGPPVNASRRLPLREAATPRPG